LPQIAPANVDTTGSLGGGPLWRVEPPHALCLSAAWWKVPVSASGQVRAERSSEVDGEWLAPRVVWTATFGASESKGNCPARALIWSEPAWARRVVHPL